jgi:hypothetical protein
MVPVKQVALDEIQLIIDLLRNKVEFTKIRKYYGRFLALGHNVQVKTVNTCYTDASESRFGFGICIEGVYYSFSSSFSKIQRSSWSINVKESYALLVMKFYYIILLKRLNKVTGDNPVMVYVDNNTALSIVATQRVSLRSVELGLIAKIIFGIKLAFPDLLWNYRRVPTEHNEWADRLSRKLVRCNISSECPLICLLMGFCSDKRNLKNLNPASYILDKLLLSGEKVQPNMKKIDL